MTRKCSLMPAAVLILLSAFIFAGCGRRTLLSRRDPVTLTFWHVNGEQSESPLEKLITEFNQTEGQKQGIIVRTSRITSAQKIQSELLRAQAGGPGAPDMPDLFTCHLSDAEAVGTEQLTDWSEYLTGEERDAFVPEFLQQGTADGRTVLLPFAASSQVLFLNETAFDRFSADTGVTEEDLSTWEGFLDAAQRYYDWSGGKTFCAFDYLMSVMELDDMERNGGRDENLYSETGWINTGDREFRKSFCRFAEAAGKGIIQQSDPFGTSQMMTGETICSIGSSAGILYYNDLVTYEDGTTEPLALRAAAMPQAADGTKMMRVSVLGLSACISDERKAEAASVFARWLTDPERNLKFASETGYMPVKSGSFERISDYDFADESTASLYGALNAMYETCSMVEDRRSAGYARNVSEVYDVLRSMQKERTADTDPSAFADTLWKTAGALR